MKNQQAKIAEETLLLLRKYEWKSISVDMIMRNLKINKKKIPEKIKNKNDLLQNINKYFDKQISIKIKSIEKSTSRDMIFEIFMIRFDLLNKYRNSIIKIFNFFKFNPKTFIKMIPSFIESIEFMAESSNIRTKGIVGVVKLKVLLVIYFSTFLTWIKDENSSLEKTMNVLNNYLNRAESLIKLL